MTGAKEQVRRCRDAPLAQKFSIESYEDFW